MISTRRPGKFSSNLKIENSDFMSNWPSARYINTEEDKECTEFRIMRQSLKKSLWKEEKNKKRAKPHVQEIPREEYTQVNCNDKTCTSTHINSEYGMHQDQNNQNMNRGNFIKHPSIKNKKVNDYDLLNPCYSDSQPMAALPINKNNSAIVICSNDSENHGEETNRVNTSRTGFSQKRDQTPKRNVMRLLNCNSSWKSVSNSRKSKVKKDTKGAKISSKRWN
jgi:hypothetical protein